MSTSMSASASPTPAETASPARVVEVEVGSGDLDLDAASVALADDDAGEGGARADAAGRSPRRARRSAQREGEADASPELASAVEAEPETEVSADLPLESRIEALLMTTDRPITEARLAEIIGLSGKGVSKRIVATIEGLNQQYQAGSRSFRAQRLAGGWQLLTLPAFGPLLHRLHEQRQQTRLSQPALETLAIVAYRQPIMRAEIEAIRGVASGEVLRSLLERRLVKIVGRAEELGRPMLYGTTSEFLKVFGLSSMDDLPQIKGLSMPPRPAAAAPASALASDHADASDGQQKLDASET